MSILLTLLFLSEQIKRNIHTTARIPEVIRRITDDDLEKSMNVLIGRIARFDSIQIFK
jgi:hypothetical protein